MGVECLRILDRCGIGAFRATEHARDWVVGSHSPPAYRAPRAGIQVGSRAGKLKADWTKPLPLAVELWALNAPGSLIDAVSGRSGRPSTRGTGWLGAIYRRYQPLERLA